MGKTQRTTGARLKVSQAVPRCTCGTPADTTQALSSMRAPISLLVMKRLVFVSFI